MYLQHTTAEAGLTFGIRHIHILDSFKNFRGEEVRTGLSLCAMNEMGAKGEQGSMEKWSGPSQERKHRGEVHIRKDSVKI